jgi:hypothetical protein
MDTSKVTSLNGQTLKRGDIVRFGGDEKLTHNAFMMTETMRKIFKSNKEYKIEGVKKNRQGNLVVNVCGYNWHVKNIYKVVNVKKPSNIFTYEPE